MPEIDNLQKIGNLSLQAAHRKHNELGLSGKEAVRKNQFGDMALRIDLEAEEAVLDVFTENNIPIKILSEEHGEVMVGTNPKYFGVLDGLDGSGVFKAGLGGRYGTMLGVYSNIDPSYNQYLYGGIMEHSQNRLYFASKSGGAFVLANGNLISLHCSQTKSLVPDHVKLCADLNYDIVNGTDKLTTLIGKLNNFNVATTRSYAADFAALVEGQIDAVIGFSRKNDLELAAAFPIISEAGGIVVDKIGRDISGLKYNDVRKNEFSLLVAAGTKELAEIIRKNLLD